ncbi:ABC transporter permease [Shewanella sp. A3A]|nr:ABC transporter permease [Shewanella ferrihydritica]
MKRLIPHSLRLAWRNIWRNQRRSLLSLLVIAIAIFAITAIAGFGLSTYESLEQAAIRTNGELLLSRPGYLKEQEETPLADGLTDSQQLTAQLLSRDEVKQVEPKVLFSGLISNGQKSAIYLGQGVTPSLFDLQGPMLTVSQGHALLPASSPRFKADEPEIMLATDLAQSLKLNIGDWVTLMSTTSSGALNALDVKVCGIFSTGVPELDKRQLFVALDTAQSLLQSQRVSTLSVYLQRSQYTGGMSQWVHQQLSTAQQPLEVTPWYESAFFYQKVRSLYDRIFGVIGVILAMVVFAALFNTLTMSVTERTTEIGTLAAMGAWPREIIGGFMREAGLLSLLGALVGGVATALLCLSLLQLNIQMPPPPGRTQGYPLTILFSIDVWLASSLLVLLVCVLAAWLAARNGVNKPITEALTYV